MSEINNRSNRPAIPDHVEQFLMDLQNLFPVGQDRPKWNEEHDTRDYGRQVFPLTPKQTKQVLMLLRDRHTFRPSVAEVKKAVNELAEYQDRDLPGHVAQSRRTVAEIRAENERHARGSQGEKLIEGTEATSGETAARQKFRDTVRALRGFRDSGRRSDTERFNQSAQDALRRFTEDIDS